MNARDEILERVRGVTQRLDAGSGRPLDDAAVRVVSAEASPADLLQRFLERWAAVGGEVLHLADWETIGQWVRQENPGAVVVDDDLPEALMRAIPGARRISAAGREGIFQAGLGITSAQGAIAETGTLILDAGAGRSRLASLAPPVHLALLSPGAILPDLLDAAGRLGPGSATVWINGPSKTADIESIIIRGVHGPRRVIVALLAE